MKDRKRIVYLSMTDKSKFIGVHKKISDTLSAARNLNYIAHSFYIKNQGIKNLLKIPFILIKIKCDMIFIRSVDPFTFILIPFVFLARLKGKIIYYDIPTPMQASYHEDKIKRNKSYVKRILYNIYYLLNGPWSYWFFNRIIQYGNENWYYRIGNNNKTILLGNGIDPNRFKLREKKYSCNINALNLIAVANVSYYHGYDRVIKAMKKWNKSESPYTIKFDIIGDGPEISYLKEIAAELNGVSILFHGNQNADYIYNAYSKAHLAVSSLGLYKLGLQFASVLKAREYCLCGIPFIAAGEDPDFNKQLDFVFNVKNDDSIDEIIEIFRNYPTVCTDLIPSDIRKYAIDNISYESKLRKLGL